MAEYPGSGIDCSELNDRLRDAYYALPEGSVVRVEVSKAGLTSIRLSGMATEVWAASRGLPCNIPELGAETPCSYLGIPMVAADDLTGYDVRMVGRTQSKRRRKHRR